MSQHKISQVPLHFKGISL